jgi:hypothetical protein
MESKDGPIKLCVETSYFMPAALGYMDRKIFYQYWAPKGAEPQGKLN